MLLHVCQRVWLKGGEEWEVQEERVGVEGAEGIGFTMTEGGVPALQSAFPTSSLILDGISPHVSAELTDKELRDANFPMDGEGRVYHLGIKAGEGCTAEEELRSALKEG